jgi:hypothetical protein
MATRHLAPLSLGGFVAVIAAVAAAAEPAPAPKPVEIVGRLQAMGSLSCVTPREARGDLPVVKLDGSGGTLPIAGLSAQVQRGVLTVGRSGGAGGAASVGIPPSGFSQMLAVEAAAGADGKKVQYALAFRWTGRRGEYHVRNLTVSSGFIDTVPFTVIDDNCNGKYNDVGEDALLLGRAPLAVPLGTAIVAGGRGYTLQVSELGDKITLTPVAGFKAGTAIVSERDGGRLLLGAVLKGPDGSCYLVGDAVPEVLPAGAHTLLFAAIGNPGAGNLAYLEATGTTVNVPESGPGGRPALIGLGRPTVKLDVTYDAAKDRVCIAAPKTDEIACKAGKLRFFYTMGTPTLDIIRIDRREDKVLERGLRLSVGQDGSPNGINLDRGKHNLDRGKKYRFELTWPNGIMDQIKGAAVLEIPLAGANK